MLGRAIGDSINIGDDITITVIGLKGSTIKLGIECPRGMKVLRTELEE